MGKNRKAPKVNISDLHMDEHNYDDGVSVWSVHKLIEHSKKFDVFDMPLAGINLSGQPWGEEWNIDWFIFQMKRVNATELKHPILLDDMGNICDGWHRIVKAIIEGERTVPAIRLETMPSPDRKTDLDDEQ